MKLNRFVFAFALAGACVLPAFGQNAPADPFAGPSGKMTPRADAYYNFTMGHLYELQYEQTSQPDYATKAIDAYKKAYAIDPKSPIIGERLAEMYWKAQRVRDAVNEANEILKHDPDDLATHRLLGRIYLRSLGDISGSGVQTEMVAKAITEYVQVHRLDPGDQEASLWLARLYRLHNEPDKAEQVLRKMLDDDPGNEAAAEQLTQLLLDENKADEAIKLLEDMTAQSTSATLFDLLGDAYTQNHDYAKAEVAYRKAVDLDPTELNHLRGLGQTLLSEEKYSDALTVYQKLIDLMPDDSDNYLRMAQIYRELHQLDKAEENLVKARQYNPGSLEVLFNEAMIYEAQGRYDDAIRVISDAITGVKAQSTGAAFEPAAARRAVSGTRDAVPRCAELPGCHLHLPGTRAFGRRRRPARALVDHGNVPAGEGHAKGAAGRQGSLGQVSGRSGDQVQPGAACWERISKPTKR